MAGRLTSRTIAAWLGLPVAVLSLTLVVFQNVDAICRATGKLCTAPHQVASSAAARPLDAFVEPFALSDANDSDLVLLHTKIERSLVELLANNHVSVGHHLAPNSNDSRARYKFVGDLSRSGDQIVLTVQLEENGQILSTTEVAAPLATFKDAYRSLPGPLLYFMNRSPVTLAVVQHPHPPTTSLPAWWMFAEAQRRAGLQQKDEALSFLDKALAADPHFATARWAKGDLLASPEMKREAEREDPDLQRISIAVAPINPMPALMAEAGRAVWTDVQQGLQLRRFAAPSYDIAVTAWSVDQSRFSINVVAAGASNGDIVTAMRQRTQAILAVNGGFWDQDSAGRMTPSGFFAADGVIVQQPQDSKGSGVLLIAPSGVLIQHATDPVPPHVQAGVQSGPILIEPGGQFGIRSNDGVRAPRTMICFSQARVVLVIVQGGLSLFEAAQLLAAPTRAGGFACERALNLDGGPSTQASFAGVPPIEIPGLWRTQSAVVVRAR